jgi:hypothetical protein
MGSLSNSFALDNNYSACYLDCDPFTPGKNGGRIAELSRRKRHETAQRVVRHRFLHSTTTATQKQHIYRGLNPECPYVTCSFLDNRSTVLALDSNGVMDIVKLSGGGLMDVDNNDNGDDDTHLLFPYNNNTKLVSSLRIHGSHASAHPESHKIMAFHGGACFAVGLSSGDVHIYDTETAGCAANFRRDHRHREVEAAAAAWLVGKRQKKAVAGAVLPTLPHAAGPHSSTRGWRARRPLRRYQGAHALCQELKNPTIVSELPELYEWDKVDEIFWGAGLTSTTTTTTSSSASPVCSSDSSSRMCWDFREVSASSLLALHVGATGDTLGVVTVADTRQRQSQNAICFDAMGRRDTCHVAAACFVSDVAVATSSSTPVGTNSSNNRLLSIWDLRKASEEAVILSIDGDNNNDVLPSFPRDSALGMTRSTSFDLDFVAAAQPSKQFRQVIRLAPFFGDTLLVSSLIWTSPKRGGSSNDFVGDVEHMVVNPSAPPSFGMVDRAVKKKPSRMTTYSWRSSFAASNSSNLLATCEKCNGRDQISLESFNLRGSYASRRGIKRKCLVDSVNSTEPKGIPVDLTDKWGTSTELNSLAFNSDGSCLVGTSSDGDLFSWRA